MSGRDPSPAASQGPPQWEDRIMSGVEPGLQHSDVSSPLPHACPHTYLLIPFIHEFIKDCIYTIVHNHPNSMSFLGGSSFKKIQFSISPSTNPSHILKLKLDDSFSRSFILLFPLGKFYKNCILLNFPSNLYLCLLF